MFSDGAIDYSFNEFLIIASNHSIWVFIRIWKDLLFLYWSNYILKLSKTIDFRQFSLILNFVQSFLKRSKINFCYVQFSCCFFVLWLFDGVATQVLENLTKWTFREAQHKLRLQHQIIWLSFIVLSIFWFALICIFKFILTFFFCKLKVLFLIFVQQTFVIL